ncbi:exodeoxyribonuclease III (xth) [Pediococcus acidilactici D3]|nr:exodeoxyribonuclease III (xth) [Pediococcus acidilactici D3]
MLILQLNVVVMNALIGIYVIFIKLKRLDFRLQWEAAFSDHLTNLATKKPVILCGDLNVAHNEIDLKNPKPNQKNAGFSIQERQAMTALLARGFTDTFRHIYPDKTGAYSWWSYRFNARARNAGWRIDYFICSNALLPPVKDSQILPEIFFFNDTATTEIYTLSLHDALPICYGVILPSSLTRVLSLTLGYSPRLPVSVCGTGS